MQENLGFKKYLGNTATNMLVVLAFRNIQRNIVRLRPLLAVFFVTFALLLVINSIIAATSDSFWQLYAQALTADLSISNEKRGNTLFGNESLLVGDFLPVPIVPDIDQIVDALAMDETLHWAGMLTLPVQAKANNSSGSYVAFGVDFESYLQLFPRIQLHSGSFPTGDTSVAAVMLQPDQHEAMGSPPIGSRLLLTASNGQNFAIREVVLLGLYTYPATDTLMARALLVDADVIRSLAGYVYAAQDLLEISEEQRELVEADLNGLFTSDPAASAVENEDDENNVLLTDVRQILGRSDELAEARTVIKGSWHFILVSSKQGDSFTQLLARLGDAGLSQANGYRFRNWRDTVGGDAVIAFYLQIFMNIGVGIVIIGAIFIIMNSVTLSILERMTEIGTMRALGAGKNIVAMLITIETVVIIFVTAFLGILFGLLLVAVINRLGISSTNYYVNILLGGNTIRGIITGELILGHTGFSILLAGLCVFYPLSKVLKIRPVQAMA